MGRKEKMTEKGYICSRILNLYAEIKVKFENSTISLVFLVLRRKMEKSKGKMCNCSGILDLYTKILVKFKKAICSIHFLFFTSAQNFSYCS